MKIVYFITGLGLGGAETQVINLCDALSKVPANKIYLIYMTGPMLIRPQSTDVQIIDLKITKFNLSRIIYAYLKARKIISTIQPDVIHSHMIHANIFTRLLRLTTKMKKLICTAHSNNEGGKIRMLAYRLTDNLCELTTNVSHMASSEFISKKAFFFKKNQTIYNGIDTNFFKFNSLKRIEIRNQYNIKDSDKLILNIARLDTPKDHQNLIEAFKIIQSSTHNTKLFIIGEGPLKKNLMELIQLYNIEDNIFFLGNKKNIPDFLSAADVFVLSSKWEGFGLVVAEALACECLCVSTDSGGPKEIIGNTGNLLVETNNPFKLADGIKYFLEISQEEKNYITAVSRRRIISLFSMDHILNIWTNIYLQKK